MSDIKPIETVYNGYRFRSRLEARWAVFFDAAKIKYEYEPEGFELSDGTKYLPDFYLPDFDTYVEVKGDREGSWEEIDKAKSMIFWGSHIRRILILGNIPPEYNGGLWHFPCFYWSGKGDCVLVGWWFFYDYYDDELVKRHGLGNISSANYHSPWCYDSDGQRRKFPKGDISFQAVSDTVLQAERDFWKSSIVSDEWDSALYDMDRLVFEAYDKARQARFEHGECG